MTEGLAGNGSAQQVEDAEGAFPVFCFADSYGSVARHLNIPTSSSWRRVLRLRHVARRVATPTSDNTVSRPMDSAVNT